LRRPPADVTSGWVADRLSAEVRAVIAWRSVAGRHEGKRARIRAER
jgi:hypothetical protein